ncbi:MAG: recombination protein NinG [Pseudoalteromonas sp.]|uniref:recombination protein NinG n=1 Tax=Pseudoalteromonas sp. TaxID=53249 RepID=UPI001D71BA49|nr:recombination protein NinG [Pseudoalteromonas sp.]NRA76738.1 recombination protein NinG [Pseudoalteromonas sp.]
MARCKVCKDKFEPKYFLQKACMKPKCLAEWARLEREKKADKVHAVKKKAFKLSDTKLQHDLTQKSFNKLRVLQEKKWFKDNNQAPTCISCGKENMDWCCGHFKSRGAQGNLRYDEKNTYLQCNRYCNMALSGNIAGNKTTRGYAAGLFVRFGEAAQGIIDYCESNTAVKKWTGEELQQMRKEFNLQIKLLQ